MAKEYVRPAWHRIGRGPDTEKLYELEEKAHAAFQVAAARLGKVLTHNESEFWTRTMPQALLDFLDSFDKTAVRLACEVYLEGRKS